MKPCIRVCTECGHDGDDMQAAIESALSDLDSFLEELAEAEVTYVGGAHRNLSVSTWQEDRLHNAAETLRAAL